MATGHSTTSSIGADRAVLAQIEKNIGTIETLSITDMQLRNFVTKFQLEQAADKAAFTSSAPNGDRLNHMERVLQRMVSLSMAVAQYVVARTTVEFNKPSSQSSYENRVESPSTPSSPEMFQTSSVADFVEGTEAWLESGAHLSFAAVEVMSMVLLAHQKFRTDLQLFMLEKSVVPYLSEAMSIPREQELNFFQEGYKTEHMRLIANLAFENPTVANAIALDDKLLMNILSGTRLDEENPGMVEWAEFAIRNLCEASQDIRTKIKKLTPIKMSSDAEAVLDGKVDYCFTEDGKVKLTTKKT